MLYLLKLQQCCKKFYFGYNNVKKYGVIYEKFKKTNEKLEKYEKLC